MELLATHQWAPTETDDEAAAAMFVHGVTGWHRTWWRVGPALAERGWRVVAIDDRFDEDLAAVLEWASER